MRLVPSSLIAVCLSACSSGSSGSTSWLVQPPVFPATDCSSAGTLTLINSTGVEQPFRALKGEGVAVSARPFFDEAPAVFTLELPERLTTRETTIPVRFEPPPFSTLVASEFEASLELTVGSTSQAVTLSGRRIDPVLPQVIDFGGVLEGSTVTRPLRLPTDAEISLVPTGGAFSLVDDGVRFSWPDGGTSASSFQSTLTARGRCQVTSTRLVATRTATLVSAVLSRVALVRRPGAGGQGAILITNSTDTPFDFTATAPVPFDFIGRDGGAVSFDGGFVSRATQSTNGRMSPGIASVAFDFTPTQAGRADAVAVLRTSHPLVPELRVPIIGATTAPELTVTPDVLRLTIKEPQQRAVVLRNEGTSDLHFRSPPYRVEVVDGGLDAIAVEPHASVGTGLSPANEVTWNITVSRPVEARVIILTDDLLHPEYPVQITEFF